MSAWQSGAVAEHGAVVLLFRWCAFCGVWLVSEGGCVMVSESEAIERLYSYAAYVPEPGGVLDAVFACQTCKGRSDEPFEHPQSDCPKCGGTGRDQEWRCVGAAHLSWFQCHPDALPDIVKYDHADCGWVSVISWGNDG